MSEFDQINFTKFITDYAIKNGVLMDEFTVNAAPERLKKELNNLFNVINILNGKRLIGWNPVENYIVGELVQNSTSDDKYYRSTRESNNKRPDLFSDYWELALNTDYTEIGDFNNFLAKDNTTPYSPSTPYNPATKGYVDYKDTLKLDIDGKAVDSALLNGEAVSAVLSNSVTKPAAVKLVQSVNNRVSAKLDASEFTAHNVMNLVKSVDGPGSGLNADYLDNKSSADFMKVANATDFDTTKIPGSYSLDSGSNGAPTTTEAYTLLVSGVGSFVSQMAMSVTNGNFYYRNFVGSWSNWKTFVGPDGNVTSADKLSTPRTIALSGDASGSVSFDGSQNVTLSTTVANDSHTHDTRYYTKSQSNGRYLGKTAKAVDSNKLDGLDSSAFLIKSTGGTVAGSTTFQNDLNVNGNLTVAGTATKINTVDMVVSDKNIELGAVDVPTDTTADGGGITLLGDSNKSIVWEKSDNKWHFSCGVSIPGGVSGTIDNAMHLNSYSEDVNATANTIVLRTNTGSINGKASDADKLDGHNSDVNATANTIPIRKSNGKIAGTVDNADKLSGKQLSVNAQADKVVLRKSDGTIEGTIDNATTLNGHTADVNANADKVVLRRTNTTIAGTVDNANTLSGHPASLTAANTVVIRKNNGDIAGNIENALKLNNYDSDVNATASTIPIRDTNGVLKGSVENAQKVDGFDTSTNATPNTIPVRNGSSDIYARLFRSTYSSQAGAPAQSADICFRNDTTDNFMRFVSRAGFLGWLGKVNDSDKLDGHDSNVNATANTIVLRNSNGDINVNKVVASSTISESSDRRIKENIVTIKDALLKVKKLRGVEYNKIKTPNFDEIGFIAQEVEDIVPELVQTDENGMKSVSYARTVSLLTEAMKEQQKTIESQQKDINELKMIVKELADNI